MIDPNINASVEDLMKPENAADLSKALDEGFKEATNTAEVKTAEAQKADNKIDDADDDKHDQANTGDSDKSKSRVEELLADRNKAKEAAADAQTEVQTLSKQVADLTKLLEGLKTGKTNERAGDQSGADGSEEGDDIDKKIEAAIAKRDAANNAQADADKSIVNQIQALETNKQTPNAKEYVDDLKALMAKHPTISAYAAYRMLQGEGIIPLEGVNRSNANRTGTGNRSKTTLLNNKSPDQMTADEQFQFLKGAEKSGDLNGLI